MKLSACWIVKNEEAKLAKSIMSVKDCAEELIVVDTGSVDGTVKIAEECGARVVHFEWVNDFSAARNFALSLASGDYVIFIDGDEYFSPSLTKADRTIIIKTFSEHHLDAVLVPRVEITADTKKELWTVPHGRMFNRKTVHYEHRVHEMAVLKNGKSPTGVILNQYRLMHFWYGAADDSSKLRRNIELLELEQPELHDEFSSFNNRAYLLREYMSLGEYDNALESGRYLIDHHEQWKVLCRTFLSDYIQRFYFLIQLATIKPSSFHRTELYEKVFLEIKSNYPNSREAVFADLYYQLIFDYCEDQFLKELDVILTKHTSLPAPICVTAQQAEALIYARAAIALYHRGDEEKSRVFKKYAEDTMPITDGESISVIIERNCKNKEDL